AEAGVGVGQHRETLAIVVAGGVGDLADQPREVVERQQADIRHPGAHAGRGPGDVHGVEAGPGDRPGAQGVEGPRHRHAPPVHQFPQPRTSRMSHASSYGPAAAIRRGSALRPRRYTVPMLTPAAALLAATLAQPPTAQEVMSAISQEYVRATVDRLA